MKELSKEKIFEYSSKELLGVMRFDFYDGGLANQWNPRDLIIELNDKKEIDLKKLQQELNYIQFDLINNYSHQNYIKSKEIYQGVVSFYKEKEVEEKTNIVNKIKLEKENSMQ